MTSMHQSHKIEVRELKLSVFHFFLCLSRYINEISLKNKKFIGFFFYKIMENLLCHKYVFFNITQCLFWDGISFELTKLI